MSHPNRSTWRSDLPVPSPEDIRALRGDLTQEQMAEQMGLGTASRWAEYENGSRRPHWAFWELVLLRAGRHPTQQLIARGSRPMIAVRPPKRKRHTTARL